MSLAPSRDEAPTGGPTYDLFVSYAETDRGWVEGYLFDALDAAGVRYVSEAAFELGAPRVAEFERAVRASRRTLLVITPAYLADAYTPFGDLLAQTFGVETGTWPVIPLTLEDAPLPPRLAMLVAVDASRRESWGVAVEKLCAAVNRPVPAAAPVPCPYPGMLPFREADAERFFGRDAEVAEMVERLRLHPFLTVIGPSGTGKSSLVLAGLLPALRSSGLFGAGDWRFIVFRPGPAPLDALDLALAGGDESARRLLVCDQFEETFTIGHEQAIAFQERLARFARAERCWVVLTVRADFYADLMSSPLWTEIRSHRVEVTPLDDAGLRTAIVRPAQAEDVHVDPALVERLVADAAGEPGVLPLVQEALVLSWEGLARRYLPVEAYQSIAGGDRRVAGQSGLQVAMARRADAALAQLSAARQVIARRVFVRLVQFGEGRADTRRQQRVVDLRSAGDDPSELDATVAHLVEHRLLTSTGGEDGGDRRIDLAHEALITGWPTLQEWLTERREAEQTRRRLDGKAAEWVRLGRGRGGLLDEIELAETERWLESADAADLGFDPALAELAAASRAAADQVRTARRRRVKVLIGSLAAGLLIVAALAVWGALSARSARDAEAVAENERTEAQQQRAAADAKTAEAEQQRAAADEQRAEAQQQARIASSRQLAGDSLAQLDGRLDRAMLLAVQAYRTQPTLQAKNSLLSALEFSPRLIRQLDTGTNEVASAAVVFASGDEQVVAIVDGVLRRWDADSGEPVGSAVQVIKDQSLPLFVFSQDGRLLAAADCFVNALGTPCKIHLWDVASGTELGRPVRAPFESAGAIALSPDGRLLAVVDADPSTPVLKIWDIEASRWLGHPMRTSAQSLAFSPDGKIVATAFTILTDETGMGDTRVSLWDVESQRLIVQTPAFNSGAVNALGFTSDGELLVSGHVNGEVRLFNTSDLTENAGPYEAPHGVTDVQFSPDATVLATASAGDDHVLLWAPDYRVLDASGNPIDPTPELLAGHRGQVIDLTFSADGSRLATVGVDGRLILWTTGDEQAPRLRGQRVHTQSVELLSFDGEDVVTAGRAGDPAVATGDRELGRWDTASGELRRVPVQDDSVVALSPDGRIAAIGDRRGTISQIDLRSGEAAGPTIAAHRGMVTALTFSADGQTLISTGCAGPLDEFSFCEVAELARWDARTGRALSRGRTPSQFDRLAASPDGKTVAVAEAYGSEVWLWDVASNRVLPRALEGDDETAALAWSPDSRLLAITGYYGLEDVDASNQRDNNVIVWDAARHTRVGEPLLGHGSGVDAAAFSPDGTVLASGDFGGEIRLWDVETLSPLGGRIDTGSPVYALRFSRDGTTLASGHGNGQVSLWEMTPEGWVDRLCAAASRDLTEAEWAEFVGSEIPYEATCPEPGG